MIPTGKDATMATTATPQSIEETVTESLVSFGADGLIFTLMK